MRALALLAALGVVACGDDSGTDADMSEDMADDMVTVDSPMDDDMGPDMQTDPCADIEQCAAEGVACNGDVLTTCAPDMNGCLIETTDDCAATDGGFCDDEAAPPVCAVDPCFGLTLCDDEDRACSENTLTVCAMNADGCLVETVTDCAAEDGGICDDGGDMPVCATPADPCAGITECAAEGAICVGDTLTVCAPDAFGCLVETATPCVDFDNPDASCDDTTTATCIDGAECAGDDLCDAAGTSCDGPTLVTCAPDAYGCLRETEVDCAGGAMFGFCDESGASASCGVAPVDPCRGLTECAAEGRSCTADTLAICAPDAAGCLLETPTDCTATDAICDPTDPAMCTLVPCPAARTVVDCAAGTLSLDTSMGTTFFDGNACDATGSYTAAEAALTFVPATDVRVTFAASAAPGTTDDYQLFVLEGTEAANSCDDTSACLGSDEREGADGLVTVDLRAGSRSYVLYDLAAAAGPTTTVDIAVTCEVPVCGDGIVGAFEACDDGGTADLDGCSATCTIEAGFDCTGAPSVCAPLCSNGMLDPGEACDDGNAMDMDGCSAACVIEDGFGCTGMPSVCAPLCGNGTIDAGETCDDGNTVDGDGCTSCRTDIPSARPAVTLSGSIDMSDPLWDRPFASCTGTNTNRHFDTFDVINPTGSAIELEVSAAWTVGEDGYLFIYEAPFDPAMPLTGCVIGDDDDPVIGTDGSLLTFTADPMTEYVVVATAFSANDPIGAYTIDMTPIVCGDGIIEADEDCDDGNALAMDGCSDTCEVESGFICTGTGPSTCRAAVCGDGVIEADEECDDSNALAMDGCSDSCAVEYPFECTGEPSVCTSTCDGTLDVGEFCDDGNMVTGDGCDMCLVEAGFLCRSTGCERTSCGNSTVELGETCDDGNTVSGDGCNLCADEIPSVGTTALTFTGGLATTDAQYLRVSQTCARDPFLTTLEFYFDEYYITNSTGAAVDIDVVATWPGISDDGYLFVYDAATWDPAFPEAGCLDGDDDAPFPVSTG
ncbi:MAG: DUF4215 domain-containing protein, partial [Actinomycetota bacterium]